MTEQASEALEYSADTAETKQEEDMKNEIIQEDDKVNETEMAETKNVEIETEVSEPKKENIETLPEIQN